MKARRVVRVLPFILAVAFLAMTASIAVAGPAVLPLSVSAGGKTAAVPASLITSPSIVETAAVTSWIHTFAGTVNSTPMNLKSGVNKKKKRLDFSGPRIGFTLDEPGSVALLCTALASETATSPASTLALPGTWKNPKIMKLGKQILVVQSQRKIYLYDNKKVIKTYRCAVGQKAWPTPNGTFHIGKKVKNPTWTNGYASWSKNMPAFIGASPNNPLGTRAMYVYTGTKGGKDTGVRFHGVPHSEDSSIGHAASHGCLRMHRKDVEDFFPRVTVGTPVYIIK